MKACKLGKLLLICMPCISLIWYVVSRQSIYHYAPSNSYDYDFSKSTARNFDLVAVDGKITLPVIPQDWDTALLSVEIKPNVPLGFVLQPAIEIMGGDRRTRQTFEYGAAGIRYLNVSQLIVAKQRELRLEGHYLALSNTHVTLSLFKNGYTAKSRVLVVSPHPDDAEIAAFGLYSGADSYIVTLTAGEAGDNIYDELYPDDSEGRLKKGELRVWDSLFVPALGGVPPEHTVNLGYFDNTLANMYLKDPLPVNSMANGKHDIGVFRSRNVSKLLKDSGSAEPTWESLVNDLAHLLLAINPAIIVTPYPALDAHTDHKYATLALIEAIKKLNLTEGNLYLYTNHCPYNEYYPYGEPGDPVSLPPNFGVPPYFSSLYSHPLTAAGIRDKVLAMEAMHDLRLDTEWLTPKGALSLFGKDLKKHLTGFDKSYFRRAARSNELFFVVPVRDIYDRATVKKLAG